jgi:hypothetical protein
VSNILLGIALAGALGGTASAMMIVHALRRRGVRIDWLWLRWLIFSKYLSQYRDLTLHETGKPGLWFYAYIAAMTLALVAAIAGVALRGH